MCAEENTTSVAEAVEAAIIPVYIMGKKYDVPDSLTIMKAMEYAGYKYIRGAGCRGGICGACATVYRKEGDYRLKVGLACQTVVEPGMYLTQLPFYPSTRAVYDIERLEGKAEEVWKLYPEVFRCIACNACTKVCPMDVQVMDYIAAIKQGDLERACEISFDCIQCGLCTSRCMAETSQYHVAQMARRIRGRFLTPPSVHCDEQVEAIAAGRYEEAVSGLMALGHVDPATHAMTPETEQLKELYVSRQSEPHNAPDDWKPENTYATLNA
ncbi:MAG: 2Fe-2S iron-sulfur cluster-binding protein [Candidatus Krumholzibacteriia bacterium]